MKEKLKIVHLEDLTSDAEIVRRVLKRGEIDVEMMLVDKKPEFIRALLDFKPDIILSDHSLPSFNSLEALELVKDMGVEVPFILITSTVSEDFAVSVMRAGAWDYLLKDRMERLPSAIHNALEKHTLEKERKKYYDELAYYKYALDESAIVSILDAQGKLRYVNENFCRISKYSRYEIIGKESRIFNSGYHSTLFFKELWETVLKGEIWKGEIKNKAKDGSLYWVDTTIVPFMDDDKVYQFMVIRHDISERKIAQEKIAQDERLYHALIDNITDGIVLINETSETVYQSPSAQRITGFTLEDTKDKSVFEFIHPDDLQDCMDFFQRVYTNPGIPQHNQYRILHKQGHYIWIEGTITNLLHDESVKAFIVNYRDVTKRKRAEQEINDLNESLEMKVKERTAELTEANRALEAFSYSVSHDLKSPIRSIIGFTDIIQKDYGKNFPPDLLELFEHIGSSSKRMKAIIDDLLTLAKYGKEKLKPVSVNMNDLLNKVWANISYSLPHNAVLAAEELPTISADLSMMEQVMINLLSNAVKYSSKKEEPQIEIGCMMEENTTIFFVKDNGAGFDMKHYNRLFGAFQRLHGMSEFEGTGIGLLLVKQIIEKHAGTVWAESKINEGATFYFSLPANKDS